MPKISKFVKNHIPLCVCTFGLAIVGYLGYRAVRWMLSRCCPTAEKVDQAFRRESASQSSFVDLGDRPPSLQAHWWTKITQTPDFESFKGNWKRLGNEAMRGKEIEKLKSSYKEIPRKPIIATASNYNAVLGPLSYVPGNFGMWMPGVALVAAYLAEKKQLEGLFVCDSLEALSFQLEEIGRNPSDQRCAFVVASFLSGFRGNLEPNCPQHKSTVCVEKKEGRLTIALLDPEQESSSGGIDPARFTNELWEGYDRPGSFNCRELVLRAIFKGCQSVEGDTRLLYTQVEREKIYGCAIFAIQDAVAYLRDPNFFSRITYDETKMRRIQEKYEIGTITRLPPEHMVGAQSFRIIENYRKTGEKFDEVLLGRKKTLEQYLDANTLMVDGSRPQNHYITKKLFKYLKLILCALESLSQEEIEAIIQRTLVVPPLEHS